MPDAPMVRLYEAIRAGTRVAAVARVEAYRPATQEADVLILVQEERTVEGQRVVSAPTRIEGCPVIWPGGSTRGLTMGLAVGDEVIALVRHRSHDEIDSGEPGPVQPVSTRRMNMVDAVILPGYVRPAAGPEESAFRADGQPVFALPTGEALHIGVSSATFVLVRWDQLQTFLSTLKTYLDTHTHSHFMGPTLTPTTPSPSPGNLSSNRVKVDS